MPPVLSQKTFIEGDRLFSYHNIRNSYSDDANRRVHYNHGTTKISAKVKKIPACDLANCIEVTTNAHYLYAVRTRSRGQIETSNSAKTRYIELGCLDNVIHILCHQALAAG